MNSEAILKVEHWPIERLAPYPNNPRVNDAAVPRMADSIREFGFRIPIVAKSTGEVVDGHLRLKGALALGLSHVPVALADDLSPAQIKAFRLLANRSATWADWDFDLLKVELEALKLDGFSLDITGFDLKELSGLLETTAGATDPDDTPEPPANPVSRPGDLWIMGEHRLLCGDATAAADVARLLNGAKPHLMASDPPYGVNYDPAWRNAWRKRAGVSATERTGVVVNDHRADWREAWALFPGDVAYVWHNSVHDRTVIESLEAADFVIRSQIVWAKSHFVLGRGDYHWQHETCIYGVRKGATGHWQGARDQSTLWAITTRGDETEDAKTVHSTQKPVECMRRPILNSSAAGDAIYEPFSGSGTTIIAAETTGRHCMAMEISAAYCDVAVLRWQQFTGQAAVLDGDCNSFREARADG